MNDAPLGPTNWYVLYIKPRHEKNVAAILRGKGYEELVPLYTRRTRSRTSELPLFPGYVFCRFDPADRLPVLTVPGVFAIVGCGGKPTPVRQNEIDALERMIRLGLPREPWPALTTGAPVTLARGPMQGVQGIVVEHKNITRVIISVTLLQRAVSIEVERDWLEQPFARTQAAA
jgi:transcription antitermination factor NusG